MNDDFRRMQHILFQICLIYLNADFYFVNLAKLGKIMKNILLILGTALFFTATIFAHDDFLEAARNGELAKVQHYINSGVDVNFKDDFLIHHTLS